MRWNLSVSTWNYLCEGGKDADMGRAIREAVEDGFGVELWLGWSPDPGAFERGRWDEVEELTSEAPYISLHTRTGRWDPDSLMEEVDLCSHLGGRVLVVHPSTLGAEEGEIPWKGVEEAARYAKERGIFLALENGPMEFLREAVERVDVFSAKGGLGICIDVGHAHMVEMEGEPAVAFLREFGERLVHLHLADNFGERDEHLVPGDGTVDWRAVAEELGKQGFSGYGTLELNTKDARGSARRAREFLSSLREEGG